MSSYTGLKTLSGIRSIEELNLEGKTVFIRVDFNVPLKDGVISDDKRIQAALPSIRYAMDKGAKLVLASHLGRPQKAKDPQKSKQSLSMEPVAKHLGELLKAEVILLEDPAGDGAKGLLPGLKPNQILMLENLRFHEGEEKNSSELANAIADYTDVYINDAFGASHRAHASISALPKLISERGMGFLVKKEIEMLAPLIEAPEKPFWAILGGAKVSDKIEIIRKLTDVVDGFVIGGAMAYTFLAALGKNTGKSLVEKDKISFAKDLMERLALREKKILIPVDHKVVEVLDEVSECRTTETDVIDDGWMGVDIGPKSLDLFSKELSGAKTVLWNGPMGVFEMAPFSEGTFGLARVLAESEATTIVGGGDSASAVKKSGLEEKFSHISTGGGASLEFLQGDHLPGIDALR